MTSPRCATCKWWHRGTWIDIAANAIRWDGTPHERAGTRRWEPQVRCLCHDEAQTVGACEHGRIDLAVAVGDGIYGQIITDGEFGCIRHEAMIDASEQERTLRIE